jgi:hypothetical protein
MHFLFSQARNGGTGPLERALRGTSGIFTAKSFPISQSQAMLLAQVVVRVRNACTSERHGVTPVTPGSSTAQRLRMTSSNGRRRAPDR